MSIKLLARELYRLQKEKDRLEKEVQAASFSDQPPLEDALRKVTAEWQLVRNMLDGEKIA